MEFLIGLLPAFFWGFTPVVVNKLGGNLSTNSLALHSDAESLRSEYLFLQNLNLQHR